jgi:hypothetical protein
LYIIGILSLLSLFIVIYRYSAISIARYTVDVDCRFALIIDIYRAGILLIVHRYSALNIDISDMFIYGTSIFIDSGKIKTMLYKPIFIDN